MIPEIEKSSKKRKREDSQAEEISEKPLKARNMKSIFDIELQLESPLPLEWQQFLDIKSGQIYFYNTRTQKKISRDPRKGAEPPSPGHMSLDLELNLPCGSAGKNHVGDNSEINSGYDQFINSSRDKPSPLTFKGDNQEMVTGVCKKCHMLVMMLKSSPACPNCKFMHPPDQTPPSLFNPRLSLLC